MPVFDWVNALTGGTDPYEEERNWSDTNQKRNRASIGMDENGNLIPAGQQVQPPNADQGAQSSAAGQAAASGVQQPGRQPNATKTEPSLGHILVDLQQYQEREQGFNQALGAGFAAVSQPRDRDWVRGIFNTTPPDPLQSVQMQQNLGSQQQGQDRVNSIGQMIQGPQGIQIANALNMPGSTDAEKLAALQAAYRADPQNVGKMITQTQLPTQDMANLQQIDRYVAQVQQNKPGVSPEALQLIRNAMIAHVSGPDAEKAVGDAMSYKSSHGGKDAPWVTGNGVDINKYNQFVADQKTVSDNQADAGSTFQSSVDTMNTLRGKLSALKSDPDLSRILSLPQDSPEKNAFQEALRNQNADWKDKIPQVLLIDPGGMRVLSELKEATGQEYTRALDSILGHGLRPTAQEIAQVRAGYGQTANILNFGNQKDYNAQAIDPLLTRMDEASAKAHGDAGQIDKAPDYVKPFINPIYLHGGKYHLDDGSQTPDWEKNVNKPMSDQDVAEAQAAIKKNPANTWHVVDAYRRAGYNVDRLAVVPGQ